MKRMVGKKKKVKFRSGFIPALKNLKLSGQRFCLHAMSDLLKERKRLLECVYKVC